MQVQVVRFRSGFGEVLRGFLDTDGVTLRELARRVSHEGGESQIESKRRLIRRYISGEVEPSRKARDEIAVALGRDPSVFDEDAERAAEIRQIHGAMLGLAETLHALAMKARDRDTVEVTA